MEMFSIDLMNLDDFWLQNQAKKDELDKLYRMIKLECRGNDQAVLGSYETFAVTAAQELKIQIEKVYVNFFYN